MLWEKIKNDKKIKWSLIIVIIFVVLASGVLVANATVNNLYNDKILTKVKLGEVDLGNLDYEQATDLINQRIDFINQRGFVYNNDLKPIVIYPNVVSVESSDTYHPLIIWDIDESLQQIFDWQRQKSLNHLPGKLQALWLGKKFPVIYEWDSQQYLTILQDNLAGVLTPEQEASFVWQADELEIIPEIAGQSFDYQQAMTDTLKQIDNLTSQDINLSIISGQPIIRSGDIQAMAELIKNIVNRGSLYLTFNTQEWLVPNEIWRQWLEVKSGPVTPYLGFNQELVQRYLEAEGILEQIEVPVQDAKFEIINGKVSEFVASQVGRSINWEQTILALEMLINNPGELEMELLVEVTEPRINNADVNDLGITEIIGIGESDFSGSPRNRVHNIGVGADTLDGMLIAPDEEFSLITALGEINAETGYLQELVIKGNETKPEYGGGLCQIGTTVFRATLQSGLPITARSNHSYRVSYYEPAGMDATIYNPAPDFKFINDTDNYILIKTRIEGTKLYFDFWGTKDNRKITITDPVIYNIMAPPEEKIIKTTDLEPGKTKCTESAHNGADAKFDYTVLYPDQEEPVEITFRSHYVPWQKVCLLGVTEEELLAEQASSTPEEIIEE